MFVCRVHPVLVVERVVRAVDELLLCKMNSLGIFGDIDDDYDNSVDVLAARTATAGNHQHQYPWDWLYEPPSTKQRHIPRNKPYLHSAWCVVTLC